MLIAFKDIDMSQNLSTIFKPGRYYNYMDDWISSQEPLVIVYKDQPVAEIASYSMIKSSKLRHYIDTNVFTEKVTNKNYFWLPIFVLSQHGLVKIYHKNFTAGYIDGRESIKLSKLPNSEFYEKNQIKKLCQDIEKDPNLKLTTAYIHKQTGQGFRIYPKTSNGTHIVWFDVFNYFSKTGKSLPHRSWKSFKSKEEALLWANEICNKLPNDGIKQKSRNHEIIDSVIKDKNLHKDVLKFQNKEKFFFEEYKEIVSYLPVIKGEKKGQFPQTKFNHIVTKILLNKWNEDDFITSGHIIKHMGLHKEHIGCEHFYDKVYLACSHIRRNNAKYNILTKDRGSPDTDFSINGKTRRASQIFSVMGVYNER